MPVKPLKREACKHWPPKHRFCPQEGSAEHQGVPHHCHLRGEGEGARVLCRQGWRHPCGPWACPNFLRQCQVSLVGGEVRSFDFFEVDCISSFATSSSPSGTKLAATSSFSGRGSEMCRSVIRTRARPRRRGLVLVQLARAQAESAGCESGARSSARRLTLCPRYGS